MLLVVSDGDPPDGVEGEDGGLVGTDLVGVGTRGRSVKTCGSTTATESLKLVVTTGAGDGVISEVFDGGFSVTVTEGIVGGSVGLVVVTESGREIESFG